MKYIVTERGSEYNDEYYSLNENGYTIVSKLYDSRKEAEEIGMKEAILNLFRNKNKTLHSEYFDFKMFGEGWSLEDLEEHFREKGYEFDESDYEMFLPPNLNEEEILEAFNKFDVQLFEIIEIEE